MYGILYILMFARILFNEGPRTLLDIVWDSLVFFRKYMPYLKKKKLNKQTKKKLKPLNF